MATIGKIKQHKQYFSKQNHFSWMGSKNGKERNGFIYDRKFKFKFLNKIAEEQVFKIYEIANGGKGVLNMDPEGQIWAGQWVIYGGSQTAPVANTSNDQRNKYENQDPDIKNDYQYKFTTSLGNTIYFNTLGFDDGQTKYFIE